MAECVSSMFTAGLCYVRSTCKRPVRDGGLKKALGTCTVATCQPIYLPLVGGGESPPAGLPGIISGCAVSFCFLPLQILL